MTKEKMNEVTEFLNENLEIAVDVAKEINWYNDRLFPEFNAIELEEIDGLTSEDLENQVVEYIDEIVEKINELYPDKISIWDDDLRELINED